LVYRGLPQICCLGAMDRGSKEKGKVGGQRNWGKKDEACTRGGKKGKGRGVENIKKSPKTEAFGFHTHGYENGEWGGNLGGGGPVVF